MNTIEKVIEHIKRITEGDKLITVGSSAGGYMAILIGEILRADYVIAFSPQFELKNRWAMDVNPFLKKYADDPERLKYYDIKPIIQKNTVPVYCIQPIKCESDKYQYNLMKNLPEIKFFAFNSSHHGVVVLKNNLSKLISMRQSEWDRLYERYKGQKISPILFSIHLVGIVRTGSEIFHTGIRVLRKFKKRR